MSRKKALNNAISAVQSDSVMARFQISRTLRGATERERVAAILSQEQSAAVGPSGARRVYAACRLGLSAGPRPTHAAGSENMEK